MAIPRKPRMSMREQLRLIQECRQSGLTDADWCRENDINPSTFYGWVSRCRNSAGKDAVEAPRYGHSDSPAACQEVVPVQIIPDAPSAPAPVNLDNSHTIEISWNGASIRISNGADPLLLEQVLRGMKAFLC